jgi:hypothetical protein
MTVRRILPRFVVRKTGAGSARFGPRCDDRDNRIERVHIREGGQAIVGSVNSGPKGYGCT